MRILIGENYRSEFFSILGMLNTDRPCPAFEGRSITIGGTRHNPTITYGEENITFVYTSSIETAQYEDAEEANADNALGFTRAGATWFSRLRGDAAIVAADTRWEDFMGKISQLYHNRFSIVEYCQDPTKQAIPLATARSLGERTLSVLLGKEIALHEGNFKDVSSNSDTADMMDVYILYLRLSVGYGSSEPKTVLGSVCLKRKNNDTDFLPVSHEEASDVMKLFSATGSNESQLKELNSSLASSSSDELHNRARELHKSACDALANMVNKTKSNPHGSARGNFIEYLNLDEYEEKIIAQLLNRTSHNNAVLECRKIELLSISHVRWDNNVFEYYEEDTPRLRFVFSLNDSVSVSCINCGENVVNNNVFLINPQSEDDEPEQVRIFDEGLTDQIRAEIANQFKSEHLITIQGCSNGQASDRCKRLRCISKAAEQCFCYEETVDRNGTKIKQKRWYCKDCDKPEVVCYGKDYLPFPTSSAKFSISERKMIPESEAEKCSICGRYYTKGEGEQKIKLCDLCKKVKTFMSGFTSPDQRELRLYKRYAAAVPLHDRMTAKRKAAFEDSGIVLIVIGNHVYEFDKLFSLTAKRIPSAKRLKNLPPVM